MSAENFHIKIISTIISTPHGELVALARDDILKLVNYLNQAGKRENDSLYNFLQHLLSAFDKVKD